MVTARRLDPQYTPEEYLASEEQAQGKSEYVQGRIYALAGGSVNHNRITSSVNAQLHLALQNMPCEAFSSDMRLLVTENGLYTYPDAMIVCGGPEFPPDRNDTVTNPSVIVEVLSPSTQDYDRGQKFESYRSIPTLRDYILIHQDRVYIEHYQRLEAGRWLLTELNDVDSTLVLDSLGVSLSLHRNYQRVDWSAA
jgi:Uma2 family endonuclease